MWLRYSQLTPALLHVGRMPPLVSGGLARSLEPFLKKSEPPPPPCVACGARACDCDWWDVLFGKRMPRR